MLRKSVARRRDVSFRPGSVWLGAVTLLVACSNGGVSNAPTPIKTALEPFARAGFACASAAAGSDNSALAQWECDQETASGTVLALIVDGDSSHIKQVLAVIDQSKAPPTSAGPAVAFFRRAATIDLGAPSGDIAAWIPTAIEAGGQQAFGSVLVTLDPLRNVSHLVLFVQD
jgi:hypothetical protein